MAKGDHAELKPYGRKPVVKRSHQITIPTEARKDLGIVGGEGVLLFGDLDNRWLIVIREPPTDEQVALAIKHAKAAVTRTAAAPSKPRP
jgi:bifunctional DNA-binding transcriptional regulator/antitoxin component of YhaV-PrlF toxin-antitoxin module